MNSFLFPLLLVAGLLQAPAGIPARQAPVPKPAAKPAAPMITWSAERRLTLADFQAPAPTGSPLSASTASNIKADAACKDYVFSSTASATFDPSTSWVRNPQKASE